MKISKLYSIIVVFVISGILLTSISAQESPKSHDAEVLQLGINDTYDGVRNGVRLILSYNHNSSMFVGSVENITSELIEFVSVRILLSNGSSLGPTVLNAFEPSNQKKIKFQDKGQIFNWWLAHTTLSDSEQKDLDDVDTKSGKIYKGENAKEVVNQDQSESKDINKDEQTAEDTHKINRSTQNIHNAVKSTESLHDAVKSTENLHNAVKSTEEVHNAVKSTESLHDAVKSTEEVHDAVKSTKDVHETAKPTEDKK